MNFQWQNRIHRPHIDLRQHQGHAKGLSFLNQPKSYVLWRPDLKTTAKEWRCKPPSSLLGFRCRDDVLEVQKLLTLHGIDVGVVAPLGAGVLRFLNQVNL